MRACLVSASLLSLLFAQSLIAQEPATSAPVIRTETNLVLIPAQVRSHGQHVPNLKQDSFTLLRDGKPQKISVFEEVRTSTERPQRVPVGPKEFTNQFVGSPQAARYTVIAIDRVNTASLDLNRVRAGLIKFLALAVDKGEPIRLISIESSGLHIIQDFTTDPKVLASALNRGTSGGANPEQTSRAVDEYAQQVATIIDSSKNSDAALANLLARLDQAKDIENKQAAFQERSSRINSLEALQQIALSLSGLPGRKSLVWASSGYPFSSVFQTTRGGVTADYSQLSEAIALDEYTTHLLSNANIAMYPIDARGMVNTAWDSVDPSHKYSPTAAEKTGRQESNRDVLSTFDHLADGTGGKACYNRTDLADCFKEALDDSRDYYIVGFYVDGKNTKEGWHKLQIKVDEKSTSVRSRNGFLFTRSDPEKTREQDMSTAVHSLLVDSAIPFKGGWTTTQKKGDKIANSFVLQVAPEANVIDPNERKLNLEFVGIARAKDGTVVGHFAQKIQRTLPAEAVATIQQAGVVYKNFIELPPGEFLVRIVVRDNNTGRTGAANSLLKVEN